jgi:hypothetical protein
MAIGRPDGHGREREVIPPATAVPDPQSFCGEIEFDLQHLQARPQLREHGGWVVTVPLGIEWTTVAGWCAIRPGLIGENRAVVRRPRESCHQVGAIGDQVPDADFRFMFPVTTEGLWRDMLATET